MQYKVIQCNTVQYITIKRLMPSIPGLNLAHYVTTGNLFLYVVFCSLALWENLIWKVLNIF